MPLKVPQLSSEQRRQMLARLEETIGRSDYHKLVDMVGEDALLEQILIQLSEKPPLPEKAKNKFKDFAQTCLAFVFLLSILGVFGNVLAVVAGIIFVGLNFVNLSKEEREYFIIGTIAGGVLGLVVGGVLGAVFPGVGGIGKGVLFGGLIGIAVPSVYLYIRGLYG